jgi:membrane dipeptidase
VTDRQLDAIRDSDGLVGVNFAVSALRADGENDPQTSLEVRIRQSDYLVQRIGLARVGFDSDFDGATMPQDIGMSQDCPACWSGCSSTAMMQHFVSWGMKTGGAPCARPGGRA